MTLLRLCGAGRCCACGVQGCYAGWYYVTRLVGRFFNYARCLVREWCGLAVAWVDFRCSFICCIPWRCQAFVALSV